MQRTTIVAEERTLYRLRQLAQARGVSVSEVIREALEEKLDREQPPLRFLGAGGSRPQDMPAARQADEDERYRPEDFRAG